MAAIGNITCEVSIDVTEETAAGCLFILQMYLNNHPEAKIEEYRKKNEAGETKRYLFFKKQQEVGVS